MRSPNKCLFIIALMCLAYAIFPSNCLARLGWEARLSGVASAAGSSAVTQDPPELGPNARAEREISSGETHAYRIAMTDGQFVRALVKGQNIKLLVKLQEPGGEKIFERNRNHQLRPEVIMALARQTGYHSLTVSAIGETGLRGRYTIVIEDLRNALPEDRQRVTAEGLMAEGERLRGQGNSRSYGQALEKFEESLLKWRALGEVRGEAEALNFMGLIHRAVGDSRKALNLYNQALPLFQGAGDRLGEAETLSNMAVAHFALGDLQKSLNLSKQALPIRWELGDRQGEVSTLNNIGSVYWASGDSMMALDFYNQTLPLRRELGDRSGEAITLNNIGTAYSAMGEPQMALESYLKALPLRRQEKDLSGEATTLRNIGMIYHGLGDPQKALLYNEQSRQLIEDAGDKRALAYTLRNIALAHSGMGDEQKALDYSQQALTVAREVNDQRVIAQILNMMGSIYTELGDYREALDYRSQALPIFRTNGDRGGQAVTLEGIGRVYAEWAELKEWDKALEHYRQALAIQKELKSPQGESYSLLGIARVERERGNFAVARANVEAAIEIVESVRARIKVQELRASYLSINQELYEFYIDLLMSMRRDSASDRYAAAALEVNERRIARSLLDSLMDASAEIREGADPQLLAEERALSRRINAKEAYRLQLLNGKSAQEQARMWKTS